MNALRPFRGSGLLLPLLWCLNNVVGAPLPNPGAAAGNRFGQAVAVAGPRVVVGAPSNDTGANDAGVAYVYDFRAATIAPLTLTNPVPSSSGLFGAAVALLGNYLAIGASGNPTGGVVYVYDLDGGAPTVPLLTLTNPYPEVWPGFGACLAAWQTHLVVGAPGIQNGPTISEGVAHAYDLAGATPAVPIKKLNNPNHSPYDNFATSVAIWDSNVIIGATLIDKETSIHAGRVYLFDLALASDDPFVAEFRNPNLSDNAEFGVSVAMAGLKFVVGTKNAGEVYVYDLGGSIPGPPVLTLTNPVPAPGQHFGISVAMSDTRIVVGEDVGGSVYIYDLASARPAVPVATISNPTPAAGDEFGRAVAVSGVRVVVGAPADDADAADSGAAHVFTVGPTLRLMPDGDQLLQLSWSPPDRDFVLQCADRLAPDRWRDYGTGFVQPVTIHTTNQLPFYRLVAAGAPGLVINEVDYDQIGTDTTEFVELFNRSTSAYDLAGLALIFVNGNGNAEYSRVNLTGTLGPGEYLLVASTTVIAPAGVRRIDFGLPDNNIQNGSPDGIALVNTITLQILDALSYEGGITTAIINGFPGTYNLVEGAQLPLNVQDSNVTPGSLVRKPNGADTNDATTDWQFTTTPTPGIAN